LPFAPRPSSDDCANESMYRYKDRMDRFFSYIPGMSSRVGNHIDFPNYGTDELVEIAQVMARDLEYFMDEQ